MYITGSEHLLCISTSYIIIQILTYSLFAQFWKNHQQSAPTSTFPPSKHHIGTFFPSSPNKIDFSPSTWRMLSGGQTKNMAFVKHRFIGNVLQSTTCVCSTHGVKFLRLSARHSKDLHLPYPQCTFLHTWESHSDCFFSLKWACMIKNICWSGCFVGKILENLRHLCFNLLTFIVFIYI